MPEDSRPWSGIALGDSGPYSDDNWTDSWLALIAPTIATDGVFFNQLNELNLSGAASPVSIDTGRALVDGTYYQNITTAVTQIIATPAAPNERIDLIVLRKDWALQTVRITTIAGVAAAVGAAVPPLPTQVDQTTWDLPLWEVRIDDAGVITHYRDRRAFIGQYEPSGYSTREATYLEDEFFMPNTAIADGDVIKSFAYNIDAGAGNAITVLSEAGFSSGGIALAHGAGTGDFIAVTTTNFRPDLIAAKLLMILKEPNFADVNLDRVMGFVAAANTLTPTDGTFFYNDRSVDGNWHARSRAGGFQEDTDTGIALSNTWKDLEIRVRTGPASGIAEYLIDGAVVATHFTRVPLDTSQLLSLGIFDNAVAPVSQAYQHIDLVKVGPDGRP